MADPRYITAGEIRSIDVPSYQASRILTNAEFLTLPTTAIEIIPAGGVGIYTLPIHVVLSEIGEGGFTNVNADAYLGVGATGSELSTAAFFTIDDVNWAFISGFGTGYIMGGASTSFSTATTNLSTSYNANTAFNIKAFNSDGDFHDGNEGNTLTVSMIYHKLDTATGLFI